jgi:tyrosine-protein kinase Etk/Wzc
MKNESYYSQEQIEENDESIDIIALLLYYLRYWKLFVVSVVVMLGATYVYLKCKPLMYEVNTTLLLKDDKKGGGFQEMGLLKDLDALSMIQSNVDNEIEILKAKDLSTKVVRKMGLYVSYFEDGFFIDKKLYGKKCPLRIVLPAIKLDSIKNVIEMQVEIRPSGECIFRGEANHNRYSVIANITDSIVKLPMGDIMLQHIKLPEKPQIVKVKISHPLEVANEFLRNMSMELTSKSTTIVKITLKSDNIEVAKDFLNQLINEYNEENTDDQNIVAHNTAKFIDERLFSISKELNDVETRIEGYMQTEGLTDITAQAQLLITQSGDYEKKILETEIQLSILSDIENLMKKEENTHQLLPANAGIQNNGLQLLINDYNTLILKRNKLATTASVSNKSLSDMNTQIESIYNSVLISIRNEKRTQLLTKQNLIKNNLNNINNIKSIPRQLKQYTEIKRQQEVKQALYLYLLQKKEENYLKIMVVVPKGKIVDKPYSLETPVAPNKKIHLLLALCLGLILPVIGLYVMGLFRYRVEGLEDLKKESKVPILGIIPKSKELDNVIMHEHSKDSLTEMIRLLRANLLFVLNSHDKKIINVVSGVAGEGKTFVTINLALSLAFMEKKVLVVGLDVRRPRLAEYMGIENTKGITLYLSGSISKDELIYKRVLNEYLSVIPAGPVPPNPSELLMRSELDVLMHEYRNQFDYILIDTAPIGTVSDSFSLNRFADVSLYVVRASYTPKRYVHEANMLFENHKLNNMYLVLNAEYDENKRYTYGYAKYESSVKKTRKI